MAFFLLDTHTETSSELLQCGAGSGLKIINWDARAAGTDLKAKSAREVAKASRKVMQVVGRGAWLHMASSWKSLRGSSGNNSKLAIAGSESSLPTSVGIDGKLRIPASDNTECTTPSTLLGNNNLRGPENHHVKQRVKHHQAWLLRPLLLRISPTGVPLMHRVSRAPLVRRLASSRAMCSPTSCHQSNVASRRQRYPWQHTHTQAPCSNSSCACEHNLLHICSTDFTTPCVWVLAPACASPPLPWL